MTPSWRLLLLTFAFVLFAVAAYLSEKLADRLARAALAFVVLAWLVA
jgi:hypothetical protein